MARVGFLGMAEVVGVANPTIAELAVAIAGIILAASFGAAKLVSATGPRRGTTLAFSVPLPAWDQVGSPTPRRASAGFTRLRTPRGPPEAEMDSAGGPRPGRHPAEVLLAALGKDRFTSQTLAEHAGATRRPTIRHGPWGAQQRHLEDVNQAGMGAFFCVNHTDLRGRTAANVTEVAAFFADFDGAPLPSSWPLPPTAIVESSEGRYHVYWRVLNAPLDAFCRVQKHLSVLFDSDPKVVDLPRVMRLPGLYHVKREPFLSRLVQIEPANVFEHEVFVAAFAVPAVAPVVAVVRQAPRALAGGGRLRRYVWRAVLGEHDRVASAPEGDRNHCLYLAAVNLGSLVGAGVLGEDDARDALLAGVNASAAPLPAWEAERTIASGLAFGRRYPRWLGGGHE